MDDQKDTYAQVDLLVSYHKVFKESEDGKKVLEDLKKVFHYDQEVYYERDPQRIVWHAGGRSVIARILTLLEMDPGDLQKELQRREKESDNELTDW